MRGRYVLTTPGEILAELFEVPRPVELVARYNIAPTQPVPIVRVTEEGAREMAQVSWGLVPHWAKEREIGNRLINACAETLAEQPAFRSSFKHERCLIPADAFYEWRTEAGGRQPYLLRLRGGGPFAFAGLWSRWRDPTAETPFDSCAIVTTAPNELAATIHDRMPAILPRERHALWLDPTVDDPVALGALLAPLPAEAMEVYPVSKRVNNPAHEDPRCIEPLR